MKMSERTKALGVFTLVVGFLLFVNVVTERIELTEIQSYNSESLTTAQLELQESILEKTKNLTKVIHDDGKTYYLYGKTKKSFFGRNRSRWGFDRPEWLDKENRPILKDSDKNRITALAAKEKIMDVPWWMFMDRTEMTVGEYNSKQFAIDTSIFWGLILSLISYRYIRGRKVVGSILGLSLLTILVVLPVYISGLWAAAIWTLSWICIFTILCLWPSELPEEVGRQDDEDDVIKST